MVRIVFLDRSTIGPIGRADEAALSRTNGSSMRNARPTRWSQRLAGARIAITNKVPIRGRASRSSCRDLKMIAVAATGYDVIDVPACRERGVVVSNVRGYAVNTVPEHTFALILALRRGIVGYRQDVIDGAMAEGRPVLLLHAPDPRSRRLHARHHRRGRDRPVGGPARPGLRHAHAVCRAQGRERPRPALHAIRRGAGDQRRHHAAQPADCPARAT